MSITLQAQERESLKYSSTRKLRNEGNIPAVVYGQKIKSKPIYIDGADFIKTIKKSGRHGVLTLNINDEKYPVMLHEVQMDPLKSEIVHADFQVVDLSTEVQVEVNVMLTGEAAGVKEGGVLQQALHQLSIRALPQDVPSAIEVDITNLQIGETVTVEQIHNEGKYEINHESGETIASILPPKQEDDINSGEQQGEIAQEDENDVQKEE